MYHRELIQVRNVSYKNFLLKILYKHLVNRTIFISTNLLPVGLLEDPEKYNLLYSDNKIDY